MEKVIKDGKVAVLVSHGFGTGWYSWHSKEALVFHPKIVELVEQNKHDEITEELCKEILGADEYICTLGADGLSVHWLPIGTPFIIEEYDGAESLKTADFLTLVA